MMNADVTAENRPDCARRRGKDRVTGDFRALPQHVNEHSRKSGWYSDLRRISSRSLDRVLPFLAETCCRTPLWGSTQDQSFPGRTSKHWREPLPTFSSSVRGRAVVVRMLAYVCLSDSRPASSVILGSRSGMGAGADARESG